MATPMERPGIEARLQRNTRWCTGVLIAIACELTTGQAAAQTAPPPFDAPAEPATPRDEPGKASAEPAKPPAEPIETPPASHPDPATEVEPPTPSEGSATAAPKPQPIPPPASAADAPAAPVVVASPPPVDTTPVRRPDPQGDRVVLLPTATTHRKGSVFISSYDIVLVQAGYAFSDDTQITLTTIPAAPEGILFLDVTLKTSLYRGGLVRAAAMGSATGLAQKEIGVVLVGRAGAAAQLCLTPSCDSSFSISSNVALAGPVVAMFNGVGLIYRVGQSVSLLGELASLIPVGKYGGEANGGMLGGGVRFHLEHWGFDLTLVRALGFSTITLPVLTATYRS